MKYIRLRDSIIKTDKYIQDEDGYFRYPYNNGRNHHIREGVNNSDILADSDNIEDLIQNGDILYLYDTYPDAVLVVDGYIKPFGYDNKISVSEWIKKSNIEFDVFAKKYKYSYNTDSNNYHKIAHYNGSGEIKVFR